MTPDPLRHFPTRLALSLTLHISLPQMLVDDKSKLSTKHSFVDLFFLFSDEL